MEDRLLDPEELTPYVATLPSGEPFPVMTSHEVAWVEHRSRRYATELDFTTLVDRDTLDHLVRLKLLSHRYQTWVAAGKNYSNQPVVPGDWRPSIIAYAQEIRQIEKGLGIDKPTRDKAKGEGSLSAYISALLLRARAFGILRSKQLARALTLVKELQTLVVFYDNCTPTERAKFKASEAAIVNWVRTVMIPEYDAIDAHFREHEQQMWAKSKVGPN